ncbi:hypothetical protein ACROYT_G015811 [Oculina patagonica]
MGSKRPLTDEDLFPLLKDYTSELLVKEADKCWLDELQRSQLKNTKPRLWKAVARLILWRSRFVIIILLVLRSISAVFLPVCLWLVLKMLNDGPNMDMKFALIYVALLGMTSTIQAVSTQHYNYATDLWGLKLKVALIGLVYKKVLNLNRYSLEATMSGNTINLVSNDAQKIEKSITNWGFVLSAPLEIITSLVILWYLIGWEALVGAAVYFVLVAFQMLMAKKAAKLREKAAAFTDKRLVVMNEIISGIRAVKMYAWEWNFRDIVRDIRRKEMSLIRFKAIIVSMAVVLFLTTLPIATLVSVTTLVLTGTHLSSATVFTLFLGLMLLRRTFCYNLSMAMHNVADAKVAIDRMQTFLNEEPEQHKAGDELSTRQLNINDGLALHFNSKAKKAPVKLTSYSKRDESLNGHCQNFNPSSTPISAANISPTNQFDVPSQPLVDQTGSTSKEPYLLLSGVSCSWNSDYHTKTLNNITLNVGCDDNMLAITGAVGSGKSSLLTAILGELPLCEGKISYHGKVAYVPQIPWIFSGTIRENILFGLPFDEEKFQNVIEVCSLTKDLSIFSNGDLTEIGQRGVTLSGGQKARVGLARAVYSDADIYLLDDPLSAVDTKVGRKLFDACIVDHLSGRIRLLVTHQLHYLKDVDHIAVMENGSITFQGGYEEVTNMEELLGSLELPDPIEDEFGPIESSSLDDCNEEAASKEIINLPSIPLVAFTKHTRGKDNVAFEGDLEMPKLQQDANGQDINIKGVLQTTNSPILSNKSVSRGDHRPVLDLKEEEESKTAGTVTLRVYWDYFKEGIPVPLVMLLAILLILAQVCLIAPNWWLARMAEMSHDQQTAPITQVIHACLVALSIIFMTGSSFFFTYTLLRAAENLHNRMSLSTIKAPVLFFDTNPAGRIQNRFSKDVGCMDDVLPPIFLHACVSCLLIICSTIVPAAVNYWLFLALLPIVGIFVYFLRYYLKSSREFKRIEAIKCSPVYSHITETANGLEIVHTSHMNRAFLYRYQDENSQAFFMVVSSSRWFGFRLDLLSSAFITIVGLAAILINENPAMAGLALTYALQTLNITQYGVRLASEVENMMTKEKIGVVGRTGAGKSSLVSALFRMPDPSGKVVIDGVDIASINLQEARRSMAVITQDPVLFGGTLKRNMDPFSQYTHHEIWTALEGVQLKTLVEGLPGQLEFKLKESGTNLSVGERQLLCLARALVQRSKIIVMDEATANVDFKTDRLIQEVIRHKFKDSTVLTIAHRLNTIMDYDKVLVLDGGRVVEFDKPEVLIGKGGFFADMVKSQNQSAKH